jgi:hypothetical protein
MTDPVTIGALAASALAMAADAVIKGATGEATRDAYKALKDKIVQWASSDVVALENTPTSTTRQAVIAEEINKQSQDDQVTVQSLANTLMEALEVSERIHPVGIDIGRLQAMRVHLGRIEVTQGTGFRAREVVTSGDFTVESLKSGK